MLHVCAAANAAALLAPVFVAARPPTMAGRSLSSTPAAVSSWCMSSERSEQSDQHHPTQQHTAHSTPAKKNATQLSHPKASMARYRGCCWMPAACCPQLGTTIALMAKLTVLQSVTLWRDKREGVKSKMGRFCGS